MPERIIAQLQTELKNLKEDVNDQKDNIEKVESRLSEIESQLIDIPRNLESLEHRILNKMDSDQVAQLKESLKLSNKTIESYKTHIGKLIWLGLGGIVSIITALILSYLSRFF